MDWIAPPALRYLTAAVVITVVAVGAGSRPEVSGQGSTTGTARTDASGTTWLCRPGLVHDPCTANLDTTTVRADGATTVTHVAPAAESAFDCFYVYPTVSREPAMNADLRVQPAETAVAVAQASRFSQVCQVWAPMYRQATLLALALGTAVDARSTAIAYQSLLAGWRDYLAHENHGRPIIVIGHSQGAAVLIALLRSQIDPTPTLRRRLVAAVILGGNVTVPTVADAAGSFQHIPACRSARQFGCVIAYSSFPGQPPPASLFGRPGQGVSLQAGQRATTGVQVLCVNPAALGGGTGHLDPYFPVADVSTRGVRVTTPWVAYPNLYTARCERAGGATWLNVAATAVPGDPRSQVTEVGGPIWGYHVADVNLALGNLVRDVHGQEMAFQAAMS
jgi:pimeloyl-ACP methyl ester carboxylesterase